MRDQAFYNAAAAMAALVVVASFIAGAYGGHLSTPAQSSRGTVGPGAPDYVYLSINANPDLAPAGADQYEPANISVPAHTLLVFVITSYDSGENPVSALYAQVSGTVGDVEFLNGSPIGVGAVPSDQVAHTFSFVSGPYASFNVAIPAAGGSSPSVVQFSAYFNTTGEFTWNCMAPCDPWSMSQSGFMTGTVTVSG